MNKFIAAEAAECIGCHACEIACAVAHNQENWPLSHSDFRPRIHVVGKGQAANPVACHHCNNAPCVTACPVNALTFVSCRSGTEFVVFFQQQAAIRLSVDYRPPKMYWL